MVLNESVIFAQIPTGVPIPGQTIKKVTTDLDLDLVSLDGGVLVKVCAVSLDPWLRDRMRDRTIPSYNEAFVLGSPLESHLVGRVIKSDNSAWKEGDNIYGLGQHSTYFIVPGANLAGFAKISPLEGIALRTYTGAAGMSGLTAYHGMNLARAQPGETIFVSSASGAVGQIVCQLAKQRGLCVIGAAGDDDKVAFLSKIGVDVAFNYKAQSTGEVLKQHPFDIFWDSVGGEILDAALEHINENGRIVGCGAMAGYNSRPEDRYGVKYTTAVFAKQLLWQGFIVVKHKELEKEFYEVMPKLIKSGKVTIREHVVHGFDNGEAFVDMLTGKAQGKAVIVLE